MSSIAVTASATGAGVITLAAPVTATNRTITLPDATGTLLSTATPGVPIGGPAFSAYASGTTTAPSGINTKVLFATEEFDTNNNFASSRFTPTVAGYYQMNTVVYSANVTGAAGLSLYVNGVLSKGGAITPAVSGIGAVASASALLYLNGSTDYAEVYLFQNSGTSSTVNISQTYTYFQAALVRSAT